VPATTNNPVSAAVFEGKFAHLRLARLTAETLKEFESVLRTLRATNALKGLVLDLRFTTGQEYPVAVAIADRFLSTEQPMVDWGEGWNMSKAKADAIDLPVAILINGKTTGAAEVLAGILRYREVGLLIGARTAGQASMSREFTLKTGQKLRVAIAPVKVAQGQELPFTGIKPDIEVEVGPEDELAWYEDAFRSNPRAARGGVNSIATNEPASALALTNRASRRRMNEAELVRMNREGQPPERERDPAQPSSRQSDGSQPQVNDPALARALDLLKGLSVVQQSRSP
jgi:carboxyl-terminal processing protease